MMSREGKSLGEGKVIGELGRGCGARNVLMDEGTLDAHESCRG